MGWFLVVILATISGIGDSQGFTFASKIWKGDVVNWYYLLRSLFGFLVGVVSYWFMVRSMQLVGVHSTEIQTLIWFTIVIVSIGILSGQIANWQKVDQLIAILVILGVGWLLLRVK